MTVGAALFMRGGATQPDTSDNLSGLLVEKNAIYVAEQDPSKAVSVALVRLEKPGFVVIHEDDGGAPGAILGASELLPAGETESPAPILLSRLTNDGEIIYAMLHVDNGDGKFDTANDKPALDSVDGAPMIMIVPVSKDATEEPELERF